MNRQPFNPDLIRGAAPPPPQPAAGTADMPPITVSQLTALIKVAIQRHLPPTVYVLGQISNCKRHASGHLYLTLKDQFSEVACVMWRSDAARLKFKPADGLEVIATGAIEVFDRAGRYQLYIRKLEPRGVGALELAYRQLCEKLRAEGLFDLPRKKPIPRFPERIVVVTSPTGAAIRDILHTLSRRYPCTHVLVYAVRVQGPGAAAEIAAAIRAVNAQQEKLGGVDVMIVGRGGGSLEDLWAFNEEVVARAIFASKIPIISGVGHETDVAISDLVADLRAPTPTAAAEMAVPDLREVLSGLASVRQRLIRAAGGKAQLCDVRLRAVLHRRMLAEPLTIVRHRAQMIDLLQHGMQRRLLRRLHDIRRRLDTFEPLVRRIAPHEYLRQTTVALRDAVHRLRFAVSHRLSRADRVTNSNAERLARLPLPTRLARAQEQVAHLSATMPTVLRHRFDMAVAGVGSLEKLLQAVGHKRVLARGYSITRLKKGRAIVRSIKDINDSTRLLTQVTDGEFESQAMNVKQLELFP